MHSHLTCNMQHAAPRAQSAYYHRHLRDMYHKPQARSKRPFSCMWLTDKRPTAAGRAKPSPSSHSPLDLRFKSGQSLWSNGFSRDAPASATGACLLTTYVRCAMRANNRARRAQTTPDTAVPPPITTTAHGALLVVYELNAPYKRDEL
jgi:hypothetical protein